MGALSGFIVRGPSQAALVAAVTLTLSVAFPPIVWLSNAVVGFYVMRYGLQASASMLALSAIGTLGLFWVVFAQPLLGVISAVVFWLPMLVSASILRKTVSLEWATLSCVGMAIVVVLMSYVILGDPAVFWAELLSKNPQLNELLEQSAQQSGVDLLGAFAQLATGLMATGVLLNTLAGLYLGRHWQAKQFQPGGFKKAFFGFDLGKPVITAALLVCVFGLLSQSGFGFSLAMPMVLLLSTQGMAVVHSVIAARQWPKLILVSVYLALLVPHTIALVCVLAVVDAWFDLRARAQRS